MAIDIRNDDLSSGHIISLLELHRQEMFKHSPPESVHALDVDAMRSPEITFWSAWIKSDFAGCAALKQLGDTHAEIKSMKTVDAQLRKGVAAALMDHVLQIARQRGYSRVSLETGTMDAFIPARALYAKHGFSECEPFADYWHDPNSVYMTKCLS